MTDLFELQYPIGKYERPEFSKENLQNHIGILRALPIWMDAAIENLDEYQLNTPYRPGGWTVQQVIHHVADSHMNAYVRLKLALTEEHPAIVPYNENLWAELPDVTLVPVNMSTTLLHALHRRMVATMEQLTPEQWERTYYHPQQCRYVPLWEMAALYAWHSAHHTEHVRQLRIRMNW